MVPNVVNLHFTDKCNYKCVYCFSKRYNNDELSVQEWFKIIDNVNTYFKVNSIYDKRINLVGGEPLLFDIVYKLVDYIYGLEIKVSIITNGSLLTKKVIDRLSPKVNMIGVSVDSLNTNTNFEIGRNNSGQLMDYNILLDNLSYIKSKKIKLKINTVVSKANYKEDFSNFLETVAPDRYKIIQVYINEGVNSNSKNLVPTELEFRKFSERHKLFKPVVEDNSKMENAYIMVDSQGNLISNIDFKYTTIGNLLNESLEDLLPKLNLNNDNFALRYKN